MTKWRGPRTRNDPTLSTKWWRVTVRNHWIALRLPCARCGKPIDYDGPRYLPNGLHNRRCKGSPCRGCRKLNPRYLHVGHKVDRYIARGLGWAESQIHAIAQTQPEHQDCSSVSGARLGQRVQAAKLAIRVRQLDESRRW
jgi:hypothetical protein